MKVLHVGIASVLLASVAGCGLLAEKNIDYSPGASQMPALDVPPDLTRPVTVDTYQVPQLAASQVVASNPTAAGVESSDVSMRVEESGVNSILIRDAFDKSWRRVGLAIESLKLAEEDKDRSKGIYYLKPIPPGGSLNLPQEAGAGPVSYRVLVKDNGMTSTVTVTAADGISDAASKVILDALYKHIRP
jgi:uncharacterized lipoprotein